ncbi:MAG TPA: ABC transporter substrate-binding protein [Burkholderiales bacterium]|jgi:ABC-type branched-subunit amino acid transport system substrate-binding protein|nr:ABC transporter substrate-binding protein [Burkholderiales bacterium]
MSVHRPFPVVPLAVAFLLGLSALRPALGEELLVGQAAAISNPATTANAKGLQAGIKTYFDYVNATGGVGGNKVTLVTKDDDLTPGKMVSITREYIADKRVVALAGFVNTGGITEVSKANLPGEAGIALIAPLQGDKSIVGAANFFPFRSGYPDEVVALVKEAANTQKKKLAVVYWNITFGPAMMKLAQQETKSLGVNVVAWVPIDAQAQDKFDANMKQAVAAVAKETPDSVLMLISGKYALEFIKQIKNSQAQDAQLYAMSIVPPGDVVKVAGEQNARGLVIAQSVPFPFTATLPLVTEYQKLMKQYAPQEPLSFSTLEGFVAGKITVEALKRAGKNPTREKVLHALNTMGEYDLGGVSVNYSPKERRGWGQIDLTVIGPNGKLLR